jgi:hypothetical protein
MEADISHTKDLSERRFRTLFFVMRLGGVPCNTKNISTVHATYNGVIVTCFCVTYFSVIMGFIVTRESLEETMNNVRVAYIFGTITWMYLSVRYVSSHPIVM